jgi:hypothetical protein
MRLPQQSAKENMPGIEEVSMLRLFLSAVALACGIVSASSAPPTPQDDSGSAPMRFSWWREGPAQECGANCRVWISAVGYITADTPRDFEMFAKADPNVRGALLILNSDGGSVLGTLALGRAIRNLGMITTIGRTTALPPAGNGDSRAILSPYGACESMCAFLLLAGARRYVPPEARVLVHQIWLGKKRKQALESNYSAQELNIVQRDIGLLVQYTIEMGGSGELLETALRVPPWEPLYRLSPYELLRMKLTTADGLFERDHVESPPAKSATSLATIGQSATPRD